MKEWFGSISALSPWVYALALSISWALAAFLVKGITVRKLLRIAERTSFQFDDLLVKSVSKPLDILILASSMLLASRLLPLNADAMKFFLLAFQLLTILTGVLFLDSFLKGFIATYRDPLQSVISPRMAQLILRIFLFSIGILIVLDLMGISITPVLASLGIGSLAVGLALQDTLSNFFSGVHLSIDKPIRIGDLVRLESGEEGFVTEIGWRSTRVQTGLNNLVVIPNNKLTGSVITNYYLPDREVVVPIQVGVSYGSDLEQVEQVTIEVAKDILRKIPGGVSNFEPVVRFHAFDASSINFVVVLKAREFGDQSLIKHKFIKALHARYQKEGIVIPFPTRAIEFSREAMDSIKSMARE